MEGAESTLKRFYLEGEMVRLQPANVEMDPIIVPASQVEVQGRLLAVPQALPLAEPPTTTVKAILPGHCPGPSVTAVSCLRTGIATK